MVAVLTSVPTGHHQLEGGCKRQTGECDAQAEAGNPQLDAYRTLLTPPESWKVWRRSSWLVTWRQRVGGR